MCLLCICWDSCWKHLILAYVAHQCGRVGDATGSLFFSSNSVSSVCWKKGVAAASLVGEYRGMVKVNGNSFPSCMLKKTRGLYVSFLAVWFVLVLPVRLQ